MSSDEKIHWRSLTSATPRDGEKVELDNPLAKKRIRLHRDALARLLYRTPPDGVAGQFTAAGFTGASREDDELREDLEHWQDRSWGLSLAPYMWSRFSDFVDSGEDAQDQRYEALKAMIAESPCPAPLVSDGQVIRLGKAEWQGSALGTALRTRRSKGTFRGGGLDVAALHALLWHGTTMIRACRTEPDASDIRSLLVSVGAAFDVHVLVYGCQGLGPGAYQYIPEDGSLIYVRPTDLRAEALEAFAGQPDVSQADATVILVADFERYQWRYRHERALRNLYVEAGRLLQPLILTATSLGMQTGITPAVRDAFFPALLGREERNWQAMHSLTVAATATTPN